MSLDTDLPAALRTAVIGAAPIVALLGRYKDEPSVHTRRPAPQGAGYPMVIIPSENAAATDQDMIRRQVPVLSRDVLIYGQQPDQLRDVDAAAELLFQLFHRKRFSISVPGFHVIEIVGRRPTAAPTSDDKLVGRLVSLTLRLQDLAG